MQHVPSIIVTATAHHRAITVLASTSIVTIYDIQRKVPLAVVESIPKLDIIPTPCRRPSYRQDPRLPREQQASVDDFKHTLWSRGHLARGSHHRTSPCEYRNTYLITNICPQHPKFNSGVWHRLEMDIWTRIARIGNAVLVSGSIFQDDRPLAVIGEGKVAVPTHFYKLLFTGSEKPLGWVLANRVGHRTTPLDTFRTDPAEIEALAGLRFARKYGD